MAEHPLSEQMEQVIRNYFRACKDADAKGVAACFSPDAVHYFPGRARLVGVEVIGNAIARFVQATGPLTKCSPLLRVTLLQWSGRSFTGNPTESPGD